MTPPRGAFLFLGCLLLAAITAAQALAGPYPKGTTVIVTGVVSDDEGRPIAGLEVALVAYRRAFDFKSMRKLKRLGRADRNVTELEAITNDKGEYRIEWAWHDFYNRFRLELRLPDNFLSSDPGQDGDERRRLQSFDLRRRIRQGTPVVQAMTVENGAAVRTLVAFLLTVDSQDERRVYQERGKPDKVQRVAFDTHEEAAWWYFEQGKIYRFRDEALESIDSFEPILPF